MFKTLRNRLLVLNMSITLAVMLVAFMVVFLTTYGNIQTENQRRLDSVAAMPSGASALPFGAQADRTVARIALADFSLSFHVLADADGAVLKAVSFIEWPEETYTQAAALALGGGGESGEIFLEGKRWLFRISAAEANALFVARENGRQTITPITEESRHIAFLDVTDSGKMLSELLTAFLISGFAMIFVIFIISLYFANRAIRPVSEAWGKQKQFVADASHELKTPLAIIGANSDALLAHGKETVDSQRKWIDYIQAEIERMNKLVSDLLCLARAEDDGLATENLPFDMSAAVTDAALSVEAMVYEKNIALTQSIEPGVMFRGDREKIKQVVLILLDNAVKYTDEYGTVDISLRKTKHTLVFSVKNSGKGIPAQDMPRLCDRFYRADTARTQENGGYGLGLSIAKAMIDRHGGKLSVESAENDQTVFTVTFAL